MTPMWYEPVSVWILPSRGDGEVHMLPQADIEGVLRYYSDTGYEPKLDWLYETIGCRTVELLDLPLIGHLWVDEAGRLNGRKHCPVGTMLYQTVHGMEAPSIVGTSVLIAHAEASSNGIDEVVRWFQKVVNDRKKSAN